MPRASLTSVSVEKLRPPKAGQLEYYDRRLPGFGVRISCKGSRSWFVMIRVHGRLTRVTLGKYPILTLADARDRARSVVLEAAEGKDPRQTQQKENDERRREQANTFGACASAFLEKHAKSRLRPSTQREYRRVLTGTDTRAWRGQPIAKITKRDVIDVLEAIDRRGSPGAAKRALAYLRKFFNWCAERDIIASPPTDRVPAPHPEVKRDRVLTELEVRYALHALESDTSQFAPVIKLLLLTGQRRAEVAGMRWSEIRDVDGKDPVWEIPGARTKNKNTHLVPLAPPVLRLLRALPRVSDLIFTTSGSTPVSGFGRAKTRLDAAINAARAADGLEKMAPWTLHDLRRTMVTMMNERLRVPPHIVEAVVNHTSGLAKAGVAGVYNRAIYLYERRSALARWAEFVSHLT